MQALLTFRPVSSGGRKDGNGRGGNADRGGRGGRGGRRGGGRGGEGRPGTNANSLLVNYVRFTSFSGAADAYVQIEQYVGALHCDECGSNLELCSIEGERLNAMCSSPECDFSCDIDPCGLNEDCEECWRIWTEELQFHAAAA